MRNNTKYSSYWLKDDLFNNNNVDGTSDKDKHSNLLTLASYKRAISNFVNIVTNDDIKVMFDERGTNSYTDGKTVTISAKMDDTEFDPVVGLALHEASHIKLTDFSSLDKLRKHEFPQPITYDYLSHLEDKHQMNYSSVRNWVSGVVKDLLNVIEDRRIDYYIYSTSPGYKGYYHSMYDKYFNDTIIDKGLKSSEYRENDWDSYMFRIINITNENRDLDALPKLRDVFNMIDLRNINRLQNTQQAFELACEIFKLIEDSLPSLQQQNQNQNQSGDGESDENQSGDGESDENQSEEGSGSGSGGDNSQTNGTDNTEGPKNDGESKQDSTDGDNTSGDAEGDDVKSGRSSYNPNGAGGDGSNNQIADNKISSGDGELSDRQKKQLKNAINKQKKFQNGDITKKKVSKTENEKLETLAKAGIDEKLVGKDYSSNNYWKTNKPTPVIIVRNFTKGLVDSGAINMLSSWYAEFNQEAITKGIQIGTMLGKRLKVRSEERSLTTPRMKNGKISGRLLHELGMGNVQIFDQSVVNKHKPALIHISIDASSSMGGKKWTNSQTAAVAIAKAASMTSNLDVIISYRAIQSSPIQPLMLIAYDSRKDKLSKINQLFKYLNSAGTTPEGLCFESILDEIIKTNKGTDSYFINFSDGMPGFSNNDIEYSGEGAINHTASQVKKMRMAGVKVLSYFITEGYYGQRMDNFKKMYGKSSEEIDVTSLIPLTRTLNKLFE
jgi:hypothetical protein